MKNKRSTGSGSSGSTNDPNTSGSTRSTPPSGAPGQPDFNDQMSGGSGGLDAARRYGTEPGTTGAGTGAGSVGGTSGVGGGTGTEGGFGSQGSFAGQGGSASYGSTGGYGGAGMTGERDTMQQAKDTVRNVASQVREDAAGAARSGYRNTANRTAETLGTVAQTLRSSTEQLHAQHQGEAIARYIERASDQAQRFAEYLRNAEPDQVVNEVRNFARRQPTLFLGGAFMMGLVASRFLRASERDQQQDPYGGGGRRDVSWNTATPRHGDELSNAWATTGDRELSTPVVREPGSPSDQGLGTAGPIGMEGDFGSGMRDDLGPDRIDRPGGFAGPDTR
jgi:hypothetical protein